MVGGEDVLAARGDPLDGPAQLKRQPGDQRVLTIGRSFDTEAAAHLGGDDTDSRLRIARHRRDLGARAERRLGGCPDPELVGRGIEPGENGPRLHADGGHARLPHPHAARERGARERRVGIPRPPAMGEGEIAGQRGMDHGRIGGQRRLDVGHGRQGLVLHRHQVGGVAGLIGGARDHRRDRVADGHNHAVGQERMWGHLHAGHGPVGGHVAERTHLRAGDDGDDAGRRRRGRGVEGGDARVRVGAAHERDVEEAGQRQIVRVPAGAREQRAVLAPPHGAADEGCRRALRRAPVPGPRGHRGMLACPAWAAPRR